MYKDTQLFKYSIKNYDNPIVALSNQFSILQRYIILHLMFRLVVRFGINKKINKRVEHNSHYKWVHCCKCWGVGKIIYKSHLIFYFIKSILNKLLLIIKLKILYSYVQNAIIFLIFIKNFTLKNSYITLNYFSQLYTTYDVHFIKFS